MLCEILFRKDSVNLGDKWKRGVPIEVLPMAYVPATKLIESTYGGKAELRMAQCKAVRILKDYAHRLL